MNALFNEQNFSGLLDAYSQSRYDFNPKALTKREIIEIKKLAREKRADYGIAPIGKNIFDYIMTKERNLYFETQSFNNLDLDGMIFVPSKSKDIAFIILNSNQPLLNQIFATAHEYYHYLTDIEMVIRNPHIVSLSKLSEKSEQKASRFAAEFLLPDEALKILVDEWLSLTGRDEIEDADVSDITKLCYMLTIRYCLPLKAVLYRLYEEGFIVPHTFNLLISNYEFIKDTFTKAKNLYKREVELLLHNENPYIYEMMYEIIPKAFNNGFVSLDKLERDSERLSLEKERMDLDIDFDDSEEQDEEDDLSHLKEKLLEKFNMDED